MLTEFLNLLRWLFLTSPKDINEMKIIVMKHFPFKGFTAMSWCGKIIVRNKQNVDDALINHETIHLKQAQTRGSWIRYYLSYLKEWIKGNPFKRPYISAYYTNPYEMEAYANEGDKNYTAEYNKTNIDKYYLDDRKTIYIKQGENPSSWKKYIKTL